jgi:acyl carrier protein
MILEKIIEIVSNQLGYDEDEINLDSNLVQDLGADNLDLVEIAMALEEEFIIEICDDEFIQIYTVKDLFDVVKKNI